MPASRAADGTRLAYDLVGDGEPVVVLRGGPRRDPDYELPGAGHFPWVDDADAFVAALAGLLADA